VLQLDLSTWEMDVEGYGVDTSAPSGCRMLLFGTSCCGLIFSKYAGNKMIRSSVEDCACAESNL